MKALVAIKRVIDYNVKARVNDSETDVDLANVKMSVNPFCEIAIEEAVRLKESGAVSEVVVVTIGADKSEEQLRTALALGADRGILISTDQNLSSFNVAKVLANIVEQEEPKLVLMGKQAIDSDNNQTAQMLAGLTDFNQATFASKVVVSGDNVEVTRELDQGLQTLSMALPAVISTDLRLNEPRFAKLPDIMKAKKKPIDKKSLEELAVDVSSNQTISKVVSPQTRSAGVKVATVAELVAKLKDEAKVIS